MITVNGSLDSISRSSIVVTPSPVIVYASSLFGDTVLSVPLVVVSVLLK